MANFGIMRFQKLKANDLGGMRNHLERMGKSSNNDIDPERTKYNYTIDGADARKLIANTNRKLNEIQQNQGKAIRKDAVVMIDTVITASPEKMNSMTRKEQERYFRDAVKFLAKQFGWENVAYARVHMDEATPHMHVGIFPQEKGRLCAKNIFSKQRLTDYQDKFFRDVSSKYGMDRGLKREEKRKHLTTEQYKHKRNIEKEKQLAEKERALNSILSDIADLPKHTKTMKSVFNKAIKASSRDERNFYLKKSAGVIDTIAKAIDNAADTANVAMQLGRDSLGIDKDWNLMSELEKEEEETKAMLREM